MSKRDIGQEILDGLNAIKAGKGRRVDVLSPDQIRKARSKLKLSQAQFAKMLNISMRTVQDWEQGRRSPAGAANSLLKIAIKRPDAIMESLSAS